MEKPTLTGTDCRDNSYCTNFIIVIARSETTCLRVMHRQAMQFTFTLVGLLLFFRNDIVYIPLPSIPSRLWREKYYMIYISPYYFLALLLHSYISSRVIPVKTGICSYYLFTIYYSLSSLSAGVWCLSSVVYFPLFVKLVLNSWLFPLTSSPLMACPPKL